MTDKMREEFEERVSSRSKHSYLLCERVDMEWVIRANIPAERIGQYVDEEVEKEWQDVLGGSQPC